MPIVYVYPNHFLPQNRESLIFSPNQVHLESDILWSTGISLFWFLQRISWASAYPKHREDLIYICFSNLSRFFASSSFRRHACANSCVDWLFLRFFIKLSSSTSSRLFFLRYEYASCLRVLKGLLSTWSANGLRWDLDNRLNTLITLLEVNVQRIFSHSLRKCVALQLSSLWSFDHFAIYQTWSQCSIIRHGESPW